MRLEISARFWSRTERISRLAKDSTLVLDVDREPAIDSTRSEYFGCTADRQAASGEEGAAIVNDLCGTISADERMTAAINTNRMEATIWVASFGPGVSIEEFVSSELRARLQASKISLFTENYPLSTDTNPTGHYILRF